MVAQAWLYGVYEYVYVAWWQNDGLYIFVIIIDYLIQYSVLYWINIIVVGLVWC